MWPNTYKSLQLNAKMAETYDSVPVLDRDIESLRGMYSVQSSTTNLSLHNPDNTYLSVPDLLNSMKWKSGEVEAAFEKFFRSTKHKPVLEKNQNAQPIITDRLVRLAMRKTIYNIKNSKK